MCQVLRGIVQEQAVLREQSIGSGDRLRAGDSQLSGEAFPARYERACRRGHPVYGGRNHRHAGSDRDEPGEASAQRRGRSIRPAGRERSPRPAAPSESPGQLRFGYAVFHSRRKFRSVVRFRGNIHRSELRGSRRNDGRSDYHGNDDRRGNGHDGIGRCNRIIRGRGGRGSCGHRGDAHPPAVRGCPVSDNIRGHIGDRYVRLLHDILRGLRGGHGTHRMSP